jgi:septal ring factor EnvC (AmiA/AmiB activator)
VKQVVEAMQAVVITLALVLGSASALNVHQARSEVQANPIRKVVTMLQNMQKKVTAEGEKEKAMFDKFMCYCENSDSTLGAAITAGDTKVEQLKTSIESDVARKAQLEQELKDAQTGRVEAKDAMAKATSVREKDAAVYAKESSSLKSNIDALGGAISAISKGMSGAFLQTNTAAVVKQIVLTGPSMSDVDRQDMMAFLSGGQGSSYVPQSGQITGILKTLKDEMDASLTSATADENAAIQSFDGLIAAKTKEVNALTAAIESKSQRVGELGVKIAMEKNDQEDTAEAIVEDKKFLADLATNCKTKKAEWADITEQRSMELVALADTIKILNDDDALEMFKKTLPGASFIQVQRSTGAIRSKALAVIAKARKTVKPVGLALDFVQAALSGKKMGFGKVIKMIDGMVAQLKVEQGDDEKKKEYCELQFDQTDDMKKSLEQKISDLETSIADAEEGIATTKSELEALSDGINALDKSVTEATEQRKEEHADYTELMANDSAAKEILEFAKNRLNKFYNPKLYKAPPKRELEFQQTVSSSGAAPPPAPEAPGPFKKKTGESNGVIAMIDLLVKDLDKEMQTAEVDEKNAQKEYESMMGDSAEKRAQDSKLITEKESMKAELQSELEASKEGKLSTTKELMGTLEYISGLHKECDWLLKNFDVRKEARDGEIDALGKAKAVLSGADFSF